MGAGTGLVGERLGRAGYSNIFGLDCSSEMMAVAAEKKCYAALVEGDANRMPFPDDRFDGNCPSMASS